MFKKKENKKSAEHRKYRRISFKKIIGIKIYDENKLVKSLDKGGISKNLSGCGILFESKQKYPLHTFVQIGIDVSSTPNVKMISVVGEIIRIEEIVENKKYEYGIRFIKVPQKDRKILTDFILEYATIGKNNKGFIDKKRKFLFHFFSSSGMSHVEKDRGWFKIPRVSKRKILE
ncbi:MAG: PilZ domain-containing protein [Candidatus Aureabacteria bacterium]|nr:PilZ domain-containing protein [Candidatus Auribacterota bacterium]